MFVLDGVIFFVLMMVIGNIGYSIMKWYTTEYFVTDYRIARKCGLNKKSEFRSISIENLLINYQFDNQLKMDVSFPILKQSGSDKILSLATLEFKPINVKSFHTPPILSRSLETHDSLSDLKEYDGNELCNWNTEVKFTDISIKTGISIKKYITNLKNSY